MDTAIKSKYNIQEITAGDGKNFPKIGQKVSVHYVGTVINSSHNTLPSKFLLKIRIG